jgi:DNA-binding GntR family transcriptional regulator
MTPELLGDLRQSIVDLKEAPRGPSFAEFRDYLDADERFHRLIAENSGNPFMLAAYEALGGQVQRFRLFGGVGITDADHAIAEHQAVFNAIELGEPEAAAAAMTEHVGRVRQRAMVDAPQA